MRRFVLICLLFLVAAAAQAHTVTIAWNASSTSGVNYRVYRAPCNGVITGGACTIEGVFVKIADVTSGTTYTDETVADGASYSYYVTSFCPTDCSDGSSGESVPGSHVAALVPGTLPVVSLTAPSAGNVSGSSVTVTATCTANYGVAGVTFTYNSQGTGLKTIGAEVTVGPYTVHWNTTAIPNGNYLLRAVCRDVTGQTATSGGIGVTNISGPTPPAHGLTGTVHR